MAFQLIRSIESSTEIAECYRVIHQAIGGQIHSVNDSLWLVKLENWTAAIAYQGYFYEDEDQARLVQTLLSFGYSSFNAVSWSKSDLSPPVLVIPTSINGLEEFRLNIMSWYVLFAGKPDWFILLADSLDFMIVAGQSELVCQILGDIPERAEACLAFRSMAESYAYKDVRRYYRHLLTEVQVTYPKAAPGDVINLGLLNWENEQPDRWSNLSHS
jgi:hypothetical protein